MGDVIGNLNSRRGRVLGMDQRGNKTDIQATAPLAEIQRYAQDLRAMTAGKGTFTMKFTRTKRSRRTWSGQDCRGVALQEGPPRRRPTSRAGGQESGVRGQMRRRRGQQAAGLTPRICDGR